VLWAWCLQAHTTLRPATGRLSSWQLRSSVCVRMYGLWRCSTVVSCECDRCWLFPLWLYVRKQLISRLRRRWLQHQPWEMCSLLPHSDKRDVQIRPTILPLPLNPPLNLTRPPHLSPTLPVSHLNSRKCVLGCTSSYSILTLEITG